MLAGYSFVAMLMVLSHSFVLEVSKSDKYFLSHHTLNAPQSGGVLGCNSDMFSPFEQTAYFDAFDSVAPRGPSGMN